MGFESCPRQLIFRNILGQGVLHCVLPWVFLSIVCSFLNEALYCSHCVCCRKSVEISLALTQMFEAVIIRELYPQSKIDIYVQVLQSDGGTRFSYRCSDNV